MAKNLGDYLNDIQSLKPLKVNTDVEVKPSTSLYYLVVGGILLTYMLFKK